MTGRVEVSDREIADAVAVVEDEMLELLCRLIEAQTTLGNEEPGQEVMRDRGWLYGRGSGDMNAGLAAIVRAVLALRRLGLAPLAPVQLQSVVEEECTGNGALQCVVSGLRLDAAVIPEPYPGVIPTAQVGVLWFHVDIAGAPAHVAEAGEGVNAIEAAYAIVAERNRFEEELNESPPPPFDVVEHPLNFNVGVISGGDWPSTVAAECTLSCRIASFPGTTVAELPRRVEEAVGSAASWNPYLAARPPGVRYDGFACEGTVLAGGEPIVEALSSAYEAVAGSPAATTPTTATTDVRAFIGAGIPAACIGPLAEHIHGVDERVFLPSVVQTAQVLALLVRDWCGLTG